MASPSTLKTLIEMSEQEIEQATRNLSDALRMVNEMEQKLVLLQQYQNDYANRFQTGYSGGLTASGYRNYRSFLEKLDLAIAGQTELLRNAKRNADGAQNLWQAASRKQKSFTTLAARATTSEQQLQGKREQRLTDEHASRKGSGH